MTPLSVCLNYVEYFDLYNLKTADRGVKFSSTKRYKIVSIKTFCRIVFCPALKHRFEQHAFGTVGDILLRGNDLYAVLFENVLIVGGVVAVAGEPVQLPDEHGVEQFVIAVFDHPLEFGTVVRLCGERAVDVCTEYGNAVPFGKFHALADLTFDALLSLVVARIPSVNDCFHD